MSYESVYAPPASFVLPQALAGIFLLAKIQSSTHGDDAAQRIMKNDHMTNAVYVRVAVPLDKGSLCGGSGLSINVAANLFFKTASMRLLWTFVWTTIAANALLNLLLSPIPLDAPQNGPDIDRDRDRQNSRGRPEESGCV